ncbi:MAG: hypothetical protein WD049_06220 [Candidatus Paceibacterota bacterium]
MTNKLPCSLPSTSFVGAVRRLTAIALVLVGFSGSAFCQQAGSADSDEASQATNERAERLFKLFDEDAASLEFIAEANEEKYSLVKQPLFRFSTEGTVFGTVYVWHDAAARLAVMGTIGSLPIRGTNTQFVELHLLKPEPILPVTIRGFPDKRWQPDVEELAFKSFAKAPAVAGSERMRLVQMRNLIRQFTAEMRHRELTNQLRLLPQPIYRYADSTKERDGALFAFVWDNGTDPELVLRIESSEQADGVVWQYQPVRLTWRELDLHHQGEQVWHVDEFLERNQPDQRTPYITGLTKPIP